MPFCVCIFPQWCQGHYLVTEKVFQRFSAWLQASYISHYDVSITNTKMVNSVGYEIKAKVIKCDLVGDEANLFKKILLSAVLRWYMNKTETPIGVGG